MNNDEVRPVIYADSKEIKKGSVFNALVDIVAKDYLGNDITNNVKVVSSNLNTDVSGIYEVTYEVIDDYSNEGDLTITVTVIECVDPIDEALTQYINAVSLTQTALSAILDSESQKIKKITENASDQSELIEVTESARTLIEAITKLEVILRNKIETLM